MVYFYQGFLNMRKNPTPVANASWWGRVSVFAAADARRPAATRDSKNGRGRNRNFGLRCWCGHQSHVASNAMAGRLHDQTQRKSWS
jgi:hypothetical protein